MLTFLLLIKIATYVSAFSAHSNKHYENKHRTDCTFAKQEKKSEIGKPKQGYSNTNQNPNTLPNSSNKNYENKFYLALINKINSLSEYGFVSALSDNTIPKEIFAQFAPFKWVNILKEYRRIAFGPVYYAFYTSLNEARTNIPNLDLTNENKDDINDRILEVEPLITKCNNVLKKLMFNLDQLNREDFFLDKVNFDDSIIENILNLKVIYSLNKDQNNNLAALQNKEINTFRNLFNLITIPVLIKNNVINDDILNQHENRREIFNSLDYFINNLEDIIEELYASNSNNNDTTFYDWFGIYKELKLNLYQIRQKLANYKTDLDEIYKLYLYKETHHVLHTKEFIRELEQNISNTNHYSGSEKSIQYRKSPMVENEYNKTKRKRLSLLKSFEHKPTIKELCFELLAKISLLAGDKENNYNKVIELFNDIIKKHENYLSKMNIVAKKHKDKHYNLNSGVKYIIEQIEETKTRNIKVRTKSIDNDKTIIVLENIFNGIYNLFNYSYIVLIKRFTYYLTYLELTQRTKESESIFSLNKEKVFEKLINTNEEKEHGDTIKKINKGNTNELFDDYNELQFINNPEDYEEYKECFERNVLHQLGIEFIDGV
eukprot:GAHX01002916.1.p1 GENE.GAHX01002916.1~~GAHX01002916.1.p1  ORF type:complete len:603 (-),score=145.13 GAHX01002916.1:170-1978(-)